MAYQHTRELKPPLTFTFFFLLIGNGEIHHVFVLLAVKCLISLFWATEKEVQSHLVDGGDAQPVEDGEVHLRHQQHGRHVGHAEKRKDGSEYVDLKDRET